MRTFRFVTVDVFTDRRFGGNPLAVFPDARGLTDAEMQSLANEMHLSETTFVLPPSNPDHTARVRIFNTTAEMPFAGHPNVGTAWVLARERAGQDLLRFEEIAGLVEVQVERDAAGQPLGATVAAPQPLTVGPTLPLDEVALCAGLQPQDIVTHRHAPVWASVGNPFVIAQVTAEALGRAGPNATEFARTLARHPALKGRYSLYLYSAEAEPLRARMFAPLSGTFEDPATGSAASPLAALLLSLGEAPEARYDIVQGVEMGRPSLLRTAARRTPDGIRATVGGGCVPMFSGEVTLD